MTIHAVLSRPLRVIMIFALLFISQSSKAQFWDEIGTTWTYHKSDPDGFSPISISLLADTVVNGINAKYINGNCACCIAETEFVYEESNRVYRHDSETNEFYLLYDFNLGAGETWDVYLGTDYLGTEWGYVTFIVDSVGTKIFDGQPYEIQYNHSVNNVAWFGSYIIKGIGGTAGLFPENGICHWPNALRCYGSPGLGDLNFSEEILGFPQDIPCDSSFTSVAQPVDSIYGYVFEDFDFDCHKDDFENIGYEGWTVRFDEIEFPVEVTTDASGYYSHDDFGNLMTGEYVEISFIKPDGSNAECCSNCSALTILSLVEPSAQVNYAVLCETEALCSSPIMDVSIGNLGIRTCTAGKYYISYCNIGCELAEDANLEIQIDDDLEITGSSIPWSSELDNLLTFDLGDVDTDACGSIYINFDSPCDDPLGTTYCSSVYAYPDSTCMTSSDLWNGAEIEVSGFCLGDSIQFIIENVGTENMTEAQEYIIIEDNVLHPGGPFYYLLNAGETIEITLPVNGYFYQIIALQPDGFPGLEVPTFWIEGCDEWGPIQVGLINQFSLGDEEPWYDIHCTQSVNSYDPNDKNGFPTGVGPTHQINQNVPLKYVIRFQNTGNAEALYVEIRDTIPTDFLELSTLRPGASSHSYEWDMQGDGVVIFKFDNINLPDSTSDLEGSQGFVQFKVEQKPHLPLGTEILNTAAIYFDTNDPIITNETLHTIGEDIFTNVKYPAGNDIELSIVEVMPNPFQDQLNIYLPDQPVGAKLNLELFDTLGKIIFTTTIENGEAFHVASKLLPSLYFFKCTTPSKKIATGKIIKTTF